VGDKYILVFIGEADRMQVFANQSVNFPVVVPAPAAAGGRSGGFDADGRTNGDKLRLLIGLQRVKRVHVEPAGGDVSGHADEMTPCAIMRLIVIEADAFQAVLERDARQRRRRAQKDRMRKIMRR
jgi:hypothetical protein